MGLGIWDKGCCVGLLSLVTACAGLSYRSNALRMTKGFASLKKGERI